MMTAPQIRRGVYTAPYRGPHGERVVVAIDSRGHCVYQALVYRETEADRVLEALWALLDAQDPHRKHLHLV